MDAFLGLPTWHRWRELLTLAHFVVAHRPGLARADHGHARQAAERAAHGRLARLAPRAPAGAMYVHPVTQLEISSTDLRAALVAGLDPKFLMPDSVRKIILKTECYAENP